MAINFNATLNFSCGIQKPCQDQYQYTLNNGELKKVNPPVDINYNTMNYSINNLFKNPIILVILESPHKDEFNGSNPIGPAQGKTGIFFFSYFANAIAQSAKLNGIYNLLSVYDIVLMNSDQYQCSNGATLNGNYLNKKQRDINWKENFSINNIDFINRIKAINPTIIINLCTNGISKPTLRNCVETAIFNNILQNTNIHYTSGNHPSSWRLKKNIIIN